MKNLETISRPSMPLITATEIVCGDCCGDGPLPFITLATADERCSRCGGRSFVQATTVYRAIARYSMNGDRTNEH